MLPLSPHSSAYPFHHSSCHSSSSCLITIPFIVRLISHHFIHLPMDHSVFSFVIRLIIHHLIRYHSSLITSLVFIRYINRHFSFLFRLTVPLSFGWPLLISSTVRPADYFTASKGSRLTSSSSQHTSENLTRPSERAHFFPTFGGVEHQSSVSGVWNEGEKIKLIMFPKELTKKKNSLQNTRNYLNCNPTLPWSD